MTLFEMTLKNNTKTFVNINFISTVKEVMRFDRDEVEYYIVTMNNGEVLEVSASSMEAAFDNIRIVNV